MTTGRLQSENNGAKESKLYPNPASSIVRLELKNDLQGINNLQVFDEVGKLVRASCKKLGEGYYEINVSPLAPGVYLVNAKTDHGTETFKFIKR